jgi:hypothetical protein
MDRFKYITSSIAACLLAASAHAYPLLTMSDGLGDTVSDNSGTITTSGSGSGVALPGVGGVLSFTGSLGVWSFSLDIGTSYPAIGSATSPAMDLDFDALSSGAGTLTIDYSQVFGPVIDSGVAASIGGTLASGASLTYTTYQDGTQITTASYSASPYSGSQSGSILGEYSTVLTQEVEVTQVGAGLTTGDAAISVPDTAMTWLLFGTGLCALAAFGQFRRSRSPIKA